MVHAAPLTGRVPPQNLEAEASLLGGLLIDREAIISIADLVQPEDFYQDSHRMVFSAMLELFESHEPIDLLNLSNRLEELNQLETVGGRTYLTELANVVPTSSHIVSYATIVQRKATLRRLLTAAGQIGELVFAETDDVEKILDESERHLFSVSQRYLKRSFAPIRQVLAEAFDRIDEIHKESGKLRGLPTGFPDLDHRLAGLQNSDLIILAARPSMGKTTLALDIVRQVAVKTKIPVGIFSLEMSKEQVVDRLLCAEAGVSLWKMRTGRLSEQGEQDDFTRIGHALGVLSETNIYIDDSATANVMEIRTKARRLQAEHGLGLLVLDYLQLMEGRGAENRVQEVSEISRNLKAIARELNIPVIALSQLSRSVESRESHQPRLADLRESGSIEQDADVVMFIYRESMYRPELPPDRRNLADVIIAKHRNGPTGKISLFFDEQRVTFRTTERQRAEPPTPAAG